MAILDKYVQTTAQGSMDGSLGNDYSWALFMTNLAADWAASGDGLHVHVMESDGYALSANQSLASVGSEAKPVTIEGYTTTTSDGGAFVLTFEAGFYFRVVNTCQFVKVLNIEVSGSVDNALLYMQCDGGHLRNAKAVNASTGTSSVGIRIDDGTGEEIYGETAGTTTNTSSAGIYCNRTHITGGHAKATSDAHCWMVDATAKDNILTNVIAEGSGSETQAGFNVTGLATGSFAINGGSIYNCENGIATDANPTDDLDPMLLKGIVIYLMGNNGINNTAGTQEVGGFVISDIAMGGLTGSRTSMSNVLENNAITLTGDPFVDAASGDFQLNNTAGAGAECRNVLPSSGWKGSGMGSVKTEAIGAVQVAAGSGGSGSSDFFWLCD